MLRTTALQKSRQPGRVTPRTTALPSAKGLRRKTFGAYHKNQSINHIQADSCEGKKASCLISGHLPVKTCQFTTKCKGDKTP